MAYEEEAGKRRITLLKSVAESDTICTANKKLVEDYTNFMVAADMKDRTIMKNIYSLKVFLDLIGSKELLKMSREDLQRAMAEVNRLNYSASVKRQVRLRVKYVFKHYIGKDEYYPTQVTWLKPGKTEKSAVTSSDIITYEEYERLVKAADSIKYKAILSLLWWSGVRIGELMDMRIKDVEIGSPVSYITVDGKTGMRRIPIIECVPYLANYINTLPDKDDPEAFLWQSLNNGKYVGSKADYSAIRMRLRFIAAKAKVKKDVNPHNFRHSAATREASRMTEQELKSYFGWTGDSKMASVYVHINSQQLTNSFMRSRGLEIANKREELPVRTCPRCKYPNGVDVRFCGICGSPLSLAEAVQLENDKQTMAKSMSKSLDNPQFLEEVIHEWLLQKAKSRK